MDTSDNEESSNEVFENNAIDVADQSECEHFFPIMTIGSPHPSDDELVDGPAYETDEEYQEEYDNTVFTNTTGNRMQHLVSEWCTCGLCERMPTEESICCNESYTIHKHRGDYQCITSVGLFKELVLNKEGLLYSRFLHSRCMDEEKRSKYLQTELDNRKLRYLAYKSFINMLSCNELGRQIRYVLPACVVSAVRNVFPNTDGQPYTGYVSLTANDGLTLP